MLEIVEQMERYSPLIPEFAASVVRRSGERTTFWKHLFD
jgi:hypothetical protein